MTSGSFWKPSRGPTSRIRTRCGRSVVSMGETYSSAARDGRTRLDHRRLGRPRLRPRRCASAAPASRSSSARATRAAPTETAERAARAGARRHLRRARQRRGGRRARRRSSSRGAVPQPVRDLHEPQDRPARGPDRRRRDRAARRGDLAARPRACSACGRARPRSRRRRWSPTGVRVVSALHTVSAAMLGDLDHELDEDVLVVRRPQGRQAPVGRRSSTQIEGLRCVDAGRLERPRIDRVAHRRS